MLTERESTTNTMGGFYIVEKKGPAKYLRNSIPQPAAIVNCPFLQLRSRRPSSAARCNGAQFESQLVARARQPDAGCRIFITSLACCIGMLFPRFGRQNKKKKKERKENLTETAAAAAATVLPVFMPKSYRQPRAVFSWASCVYRIALRRRRLTNRLDSKVQNGRINFWFSRLRVTDALTEAKVLFTIRWCLVCIA